MALFEINPRYRSWLEERGLDNAAKLIDHAGAIVSGHPDRHVLQLDLGGPKSIRAYLKREHRVPWRDRLVNAWAGFGFVSKSVREARTLEAVKAAGIGCPDWIAVGETADGRAFLLVRELAGYVDLRSYLLERQDVPIHQRRRFAQRLGEAIADLHERGFEHADLYSKHVLVHPFEEHIALIDLQRARSWPRLRWSRRWCDLAALDATLAENLATKRERLIALRAYLRATGSQRNSREAFLEGVKRVHEGALRLLRRRRIREISQPPLEAGVQNLVWLDGEALCVTRELQSAMPRDLPTYLHLDASPGAAKGELRRASVVLPGIKPATLVHRSERSLLRWLGGWLRPRLRTSPELTQAGTLFRLQRFGIRTPRLLAVGQRHQSLGWTESFLLTEELADKLPFSDWLAGKGRPHSMQERRALVRQIGETVRRMHQAGCYLGYPLIPDAAQSRAEEDTLFLQFREGLAPELVVDNLDRIQRRHRSSASLALRDLAALRSRVSPDHLGRTDELRFFLAYMGLPQLSVQAKRLILRDLPDLRCWRSSPGEP